MNKADVERLAVERTRARAAKDFARADALRAEIEAAGWMVKDTAHGAVLEEKPPFEPVDPRSIPNTLEQPADLTFSIHVLYEGFPDDLARFLAGFGPSDGSTEIIVVDNGSGDGARLEEITGGRDVVRVLHLDREVGWAEARNAGLKTSRGEIVVLVDLSIEPTGDILTPLRAAFEDPAVGVAGPFGLVSADLRDWEPTEGPDAHAIEGYLLAARRTGLARGLIDERFRWYRNADIDLSFQLRAHGGSARVVPLPVRKHAHRGWEALEPDERARRSKRNHGIFLERWRDRTDLIR